MNHKFAVGDKVLWMPVPGWEAPAEITKQTHLFFNFPFYKIKVKKSILTKWSSFNEIWFVPEAALRGYGATGSMPPYEGDDEGSSPSSPTTQDKE